MAPSREEAESTAFKMNSKASSSSSSLLRYQRHELLWKELHPDGMWDWDAAAAAAAGASNVGKKQAATTGGQQRHSRSVRRGQQLKKLTLHSDDNEPTRRSSGSHSDIELHGKYAQKYSSHKAHTSRKSHKKQEKRNKMTIKNAESNDLVDEEVLMLEVIDSWESPLPSFNLKEQTASAISHHQMFPFQQQQQHRRLIRTTTTAVVGGEGGEEDISNVWPLKRIAEVPGDLVIGGLHMVHEREDQMICGPVMPQGGLQAAEVMLFTVDRANKLGILPANITLGAYILDDCDKDTYGLQQAVDFIKGKRVFMCPIYGSEPFAGCMTSIFSDARVTCSLMRHKCTYVVRLLLATLFLPSQKCIH